MRRVVVDVKNCWWQGRRCFNARDSRDHNPKPTLSQSGTRRRTPVKPKKVQFSWQQNNLLRTTCCNGYSKTRQDVADLYRWRTCTRDMRLIMYVTRETKSFFQPSISIKTNNVLFQSSGPTNRRDQMVDHLESMQSTICVCCRLIPRVKTTLTRDSRVRKLFIGPDASIKLWPDPQLAAA